MHVHATSLVLDVVFAFFPNLLLEVLVVFLKSFDFLFQLLELVGFGLGCMAKATLLGVGVFVVGTTNATDPSNLFVAWASFGLSSTGNVAISLAFAFWPALHVGMGHGHAGIPRDSPWHH